MWILLMFDICHPWQVAHCLLKRATPHPKQTFVSVHQVECSVVVIMTHGRQVRPYQDLCFQQCGGISHLGKIHLVLVQ